MHALLAVALAWLGFADPFTAGPPSVPSPAAPSVAGEPLPVAALACEDVLQVFLLLDDPRVHTEIVGVAECDGMTVIAAIHSTGGSGGSSELTAGATVWAALYTFPSTIFAHSLVKVRLHAEELD